VTVLLDTSVVLWMVMAPDRLSERARELLRSGATTALFSAASAWEMSIKWRLGKLDLPSPPHELIPSMTTLFNLLALPVTQLHAVAVADLPDHHRDPFDRLLVAQAQVEGVPIVTADPAIAKYDVEVIAATA
jgi:PIN domain nuclease of toxin-antitoxin system